MKIHTTNYFDTFIEIAEDSKVQHSEVPPQISTKTVARMLYEMIAEQPYKFTSDMVLFECFAQKNNISEDQKAEARNLFFSKGQACMRASALPKRYGFGIHFNSEGKIALCPAESDEYQNFLNNPEIKKVKAMRSSRN